MKKMFFTVMVLGSFAGLNAQVTDSLPQGVTPTEIKVVAEAKPAVPSFAEKLNIDLFFRGGMVADSYDNDVRNNTRFVIDNARLNFQGDFNKDLFYRLRFRPVVLLRLTAKMVGLVLWTMLLLLIALVGLGNGM